MTDEVKDERGPGGRGPKTEDSKREGKRGPAVTPAAQEGANRDYEDRVAGKLHGDVTSSTGGANNPGQHGRDGGGINQGNNNPPPDEYTTNPDVRAEQDEKTRKDQEDLERRRSGEKDRGDNEKEIKKL
jgi:hypothetical protein